MALTISLIGSNQGSYSDEELSRFVTNISSEGIFNTNSGNDYKVTESSPQAMSVDIDIGQVLVTYTKNGVTWKVLVKNSVSVTKTISANISGSNRIDAVVVHLTQDEPNALKNNVGEILIVDGDGVTALSDADINTSVGDTNWYRLANITVEDSETIIQDSDIADTREFLTLSKFKEVTVDIISESTSAQGVQVDDWLFKEEAGYVTERGTSPTTPSTGDWAVFFKADGVYIIDDTGSATKLQAGGISTTQKAEAAAAAGELFENTDVGNRLSWKDAGSTVREVSMLDYIDSEGGTGTATDNHGAGTGAFSEGANIDIAIGSLAAGDKLYVKYVATVYLASRDGDASHEKYAEYGKVWEGYLGDKGLFHTDVYAANDALQDVDPHKPWQGGTISGRSVAADAQISHSCTASGTTNAATLGVPTISGNNLRFAWTHTGVVDAGASGYANATFRIQALVIRLG